MSTKPTNSHSDAGPTRESGGTTGAGNPSAGSASRTGGATSGVTSSKQTDPKPTSSQKSIPASPRQSAKTGGDQCDT